MYRNVEKNLIFIIFSSEDGMAVNERHMTRMEIARMKNAILTLEKCE